MILFIDLNMNYLVLTMIKSNIGALNFSSFLLIKNDIARLFMKNK